MVSATSIQHIPSLGSPMPGQLKINFDGYVHLSDNHSGCGYLLRDNRARVLYAKGYPVTSDFVPIIELCAIRDTVRHAEEVHSASYLWVEGDSLTVIHWANVKEPDGGLAKLIMEEVWFWVQKKA